MSLPERTSVPAVLQVRQHPATTSEIATLLSDLQVLGRTEFKQLLKWRMVVRKSLKKELGGAEAQQQQQEEEGEAGAEEDQDPEEKLMKEMGDIKQSMEKR